jgi:hypothetical protein
MKKNFHLLFFFLIICCSGYAQEIPTLLGKGDPFMVSGDNMICYEQMTNAGPNSLTSQNFETMYDSFDTQGADDFVIPAGEEWWISGVEVLGVYYNGTGPATSVNIWFYKDSLGHPGITADSIMNIVPSAGLSTGSFIISFPVPDRVILSAGIYWLSVQCNMDFAAGGQWGWTEQLPSNLESNWQNPGGGFGTPCSTWDYRVATCGVVGTAGYDDFSFRINCVSCCPPVELASLTATASKGMIELSWITATETNNSGFEVQRSSGGEFETLSFIEGHGTTTEFQAYSYTDRNVREGKYSYRLKQVDLDGSFTYSLVIEIEVEGPKIFALSQNYPNPFNPNTMIAFKLAVDSKVKLTVYNLLGETVATLVNETILAGSQEVTFNASNLNSGIYFYKLEAVGVDGSNFSRVRKMMLTE